MGNVSSLLLKRHHRVMRDTLRLSSKKGVPFFNHFISHVLSSDLMRVTIS
jgi:hypothetical protein